MADPRYLAAAHRMQSAEALRIVRSIQDQLAAGTSPVDVAARVAKHLRVGINSNAASQEGLARLLIQKGVFTLEEYSEAMVVAMEREADAWVEEVKRELGLPDGFRFV